MDRVIRFSLRLFKFGSNYLHLKPHIHLSSALDPIFTLYLGPPHIYFVPLPIPYLLCTSAHPIFTLYLGPPHIYFVPLPTLYLLCTSVHPIFTLHLGPPHINWTSYIFTLYLAQPCTSTSYPPCLKSHYGHLTFGNMLSSSVEFSISAPW